MTIGQRINHRRKELHISAEQLAEAVCVSPATIYRYENGDIEKIPVERLSAIADALFTTTDFLSGDKIEYTASELIDLHIRGAKKWASDFRFSSETRTRLIDFMVSYACNLKNVINAMAESVQSDGRIVPTKSVNSAIDAMQQLSADALLYINNDYVRNKISPSESELTEGEKLVLTFFRSIPTDQQQHFLEMGRVFADSLRKG